jgi:tetratricopeptide (TPR) repeat protein
VNDRNRSPVLPGLTGLMLLASAACSPSVPVVEQESLGAVSFATSCDPSVQDDFNRAVALLHHMTYPFAGAAFREVTARDPGCAIAYWGEAMTLFQPLWPTRPGVADMERGWGLMVRAREGSASPREELFLAAGEAFFDPEGDPDYWTRIDRWVEASTAVYATYPNDLEAAAFFALARLATSARSGDPAGRNAEAAEVLSAVLATEPTHPGAVHYTIHANDLSGRENESLDVVRTYGDIAPQNPHALHMPTHIFVRLGEWEESIGWNRRSAEAALAHRVGPSEEFTWDEYPHAVEYLVYAHLQQGDDASASELIETLTAIPDLQPSFKTAFHIASTGARFALERQDWEAASQLAVRQPETLDWDRFTWPEAVVWHARGLGAAYLERPAMVQESLDALASLSGRAADAGESYFSAQIRILELEVQGWQALTQNDSDSAIRFLREALSLENATPKHPVTPGATLPAGELLGDAYMALGEPESARNAYAASNDRIPGRLNSLLGLARASIALDDPTSARVYYAEIERRASRSSDRPGVIEARAFAKGG